MFWLLAFVFWFSLLFGTYVTGNAVGNWIALLTFIVFIRLRRRGSAPARDTAATGHSASNAQSRVATPRQPSVVDRAPAPGPRAPRRDRRWR